MHPVQMLRDAKLDEDQWQDVLAYWTAEPRGESRADHRAGLAAVLPYSREAVDRYCEVLGLGKGADETTVAILKKTDGKSAGDVLGLYCEGEI